MNEKNKTILIVICALMITSLPISGCGKNSSPDQSLGIGRIGRSIDVIFKNVIVGDHVLTNDRGNLAGKLPPAEPVEIIRRGNPELKRVAITIDDGWEPDMRILDLLKKLKVEWTAFLIGGRGVAESNPDFIRRIEESGGEVCNHTYSHYIMWGKEKWFVRFELWQSQKIITDVTHKIYPYTRFCGGEYDDSVIEWAAEQGFWVVDWTIDSRDTRRGIDADYQVNIILEELEPGAIIVFHFSGYNTYEVLARVIPEIQRRGYEVTSLTRVLEGTPYLLKKPSGKKKDEKDKKE